jgi:hypothetical protein
MRAAQSGETGRALCSSLKCRLLVAHDIGDIDAARDHRDLGVGATNEIVSQPAWARFRPAAIAALAATLQFLDVT